MRTNSKNENINKRIKQITRTYWIVPESLFKSCLKLIRPDARVQTGVMVPDMGQERPLIWEPVWAQLAKKFSASKNLEHIKKSKLK
jgi:hypothetical protein